jgi:beta-1,4-mannosyl-glycoprotein beta-1,4-N-acetylglucosaminyltransferase
MSNPCIVFEDGVVVKNTITDCLWDGMFSKALSNGTIVNYIHSCLQMNTLLVIPKCDGNINRRKDSKFHSVDWDTDIQPYIDYAKRTNKIFILGVLSQIDEEPDVNYLYIPLDDDFFANGVSPYFSGLPDWHDRSSRLCWRGGCSGVGGLDSIRVRFVEEIYKNSPDTDVRLSDWWSDNKNIPGKYFADRVDHRTFFTHKIFFVVDGNVIASNHMYAFASGSVPFLVSDGICWFSHLIVPFVHYVPVNPDLSDLLKQIEWANQNDELAEQIATNARVFSNTYFSAEYQHQHIRDTIRQFCSSERMIIDCFIFYNEIDMLNYRLNLLNPIVDFFVLVESNQTFAGNHKEIFYKKNKHLFEKFNHKIIHVVVDLPFVFPNIHYDKDEQWTNERHQRNCIDIGISQIMPSDNDIIVISDVDEIPDPITLMDVKYGRIQLPASGASLSQQMYYYNLNTLHSDIWCRSNVILYGDYSKTDANSLRDNSKLPRISRGGWHLSYFGDKKFIRNKLMEFSHQEYNNELFTAEDAIEQRIRASSDLFGRGYVSMKYIAILDNDYLPPLYETYLSNYLGENVPKFL